MSYPLSSEVSAGQPTAAAHYNNLRADALRFGADSLDACNVGDLLYNYEQGITLERLSTNRIRVAVPPGRQTAIVIDGVPLRVTNNVDLPVGSAPAGGANTYYVFAVRSTGLNTFTLDVNTASTESAGRRLIGSFYWNGSEIVNNSIESYYAAWIKDIIQYVASQTVQGRITLATGDPVPTVDKQSGTIYFTPFRGNRIGLYAPGFGWRLFSFTELSISLSGVAINKNVDIFIYDNQVNLVLDKAVWASDNARATALTTQDGVLVMNGYPEKRYLGTIRTYAAASAEDSLLKRFCWNYYNRVNRILQAVDTTSTWTYTLAAWRNANNNANNRVEVVIGVQEALVDLTLDAMGYNSGGNINAYVAIVPDGTGPAPSIGFHDTLFSSPRPTPLQVKYVNNPSIGYHYYQWMEWSEASGTTTWLGSYSAVAPTSAVQSGIAGSIVG
jgi:hypothetical protein